MSSASPSAGIPAPTTPTTSATPSPSTASVPVAPNEADTFQAMQKSVQAVGKIADAMLLGWGGTDAIRCTVREVGESGIQVVASEPHALTVGSRFEIQVEREDDPHGLADLLGDCCYATVIRTERVQGEGNGEPGISAGLRFDQPLMV